MLKTPKNILFFKNFVFSILYCLGIYFLAVYGWKDLKSYNVCTHLILLFFGYTLADLLSGITHFTLDNWPLGPLEKYLQKVRTLSEIPKEDLSKASYFAQYGLDFRLHHHYVSDILNADFNELFFRLLPGTAIYLVFSSILIIIFQAPAELGYVILVSSVFLLFTQYIHRCAHTHYNSFPIKFLQRLKFIIPVKDHARHHIATEYNYALISGWTNPLFNALLWIKKNTKMK